MTDIIKLSIILIALTSCGGGLRLNDPINKHLDTEIADRISRFKNEADTSIDHDHIETTDPIKIDEEIKKILKGINLFDNSFSAQNKADSLFISYANKSHSDKTDYIKLNELDDKREMILAIKTNELTLLDRLLFNLNLNRQ